MTTWEEFRTESVRIMKEFENYKLDYSKACDQIQVLGGDGIDDDIVQFIMDSMSEIDASPQSFAEDVQDLEASSSQEQFHELINAEPPPTQWLPNWLKRLFTRAKRFGEK